MKSSSKGPAERPHGHRDRRRPGVLAVAAVGAVLLAGRAPAQPAPGLPKVSASAEVSILGVDVVVTGKDGRPVHGLQAADVEVLHGGRAVAITNFHEERDLGTGAGPVPGPRNPSASASGEAPSEPATRRPPRHIVVFVDRLYLPEPGVRKDVFDGLKDFLGKSLAPGDEAMIVSWGDSVRIVRTFTGDLDELGRTLDAVARRAARLDAQAGELDQLAAQDLWFRSVAEAAGTSAPDAGSTDLSRQVAEAQAYNVMKAKTAALRGLVALMAGMDGRKALVLVSHRFSRYPGREYAPAGAGSAVGLGRERDGRPLLEALAEAANASGVTLYGVFPYDLESMPSAADSWTSYPTVTGVPVSARNDAIWSNEMAGLDFVTGRTGGLTAGHPGLLPGFLETVESDLGSYYSIGFPASGGGRPASVTVRVKRPGLEARTRKTVAERTAEEQMSDRALANLFAPDERATIPISIVAGEAKPKGRKFRIPIEVKIPVGLLVRSAGQASTTGRFSVFVVAASPNGDFSGVTRRRQAFEVKRGEEEAARNSHLTYTLEVESEVPEPRISLGVWDEVGGESGFALVGRRRG